MLCIIFAVQIPSAERQEKKGHQHKYVYKYTFVQSAERYRLLSKLQAFHEQNECLALIFNYSIQTTGAINLLRL
jgi:hypothetical protein